MNFHYHYWHLHQMLYKWNLYFFFYRQHRRDLELSQIEVETFDSSSLSSSSHDIERKYQQQQDDSLTETVLETFSPISPNADRSFIKPLGYCLDEFRTSVTIEPPSGILWDLNDFAKAGKLLKSPSMDVEFYDEYEMRKVYSLIYDVFRCKWESGNLFSFSSLVTSSLGHVMLCFYLSCALAGKISFHVFMLLT